MKRKLIDLQTKIEWWTLYIEQHERIYSGRHMAKAWHERMRRLKEKLIEWRLDEVDFLKEYPHLYRRKTKLVESLLHQREYHQCEKERIVRKHYETGEELDYGMVEHHQREVLLLSEELHFEFLKMTGAPRQ